MRGHLAITLAALACAAAPGSARAGEPSPPEVVPQKARVLADRGRAAHDAGDYGKAISAFKEAYVLAPTPGLLFNLAQAYRLRGNCEDAHLFYRRYLNTGPAPEARVIAEGHLHTVERCMHKRGLGIALDETSGVGTVGGAGGDGALVDDPPRRPGELQKNVGIGVAIGGGVAASLALYYAFEASSASSALEDAYAMGAKWKDVQHLDHKGERAARLGKVFGIGGGLAIAGGVTLYLLGKRAESRAMPVAIAPTSGGAEVSWAWRF